MKEVMGSEFMTMIPKSEVGPFTRWLRDEARKASKEHPRKETFDPNWLVEHLKRCFKNLLLSSRCILPI